MCGMTTAPSIPMATSMLALPRWGTNHAWPAAAPVGMHQRQLDDVTERDDPDERHHDPLDVPVAAGGDQEDLQDHGDRAPGQDRQPEQDLEAESAAQDLGHVGGDAGDHDAPAEHRGDRAGEAVVDVVGEAVAGHDAQSGGHALEQDEHECPQRDDPQQGVAELAAAGDVGGPVTGIDEAHGDDEPGTQEAQELPAEVQAEDR